MGLPGTFHFHGILHVTMKNLAVKLVIKTKQFRWCRSKTLFSRTKQKNIYSREKYLGYLDDVWNVDLPLRPIPLKPHQKS